MNKKTLFSAENHLSEEGIAICAERMLTKSLNSMQDEVLQHIEVCLECKQRILETIEILESLPTDLDKNKNTAGVQVWKIGIAAAVVLSFISIFFIIMIRHNHSTAYHKIAEKTTVTEDMDGTEKISKPPNNAEENISEKILNEKDEALMNSNLFAENYTENPVFEGMVDASFRSEEAISHVIPVKNQVFSYTKDSILFSWEFDMNEMLGLKIYLSNKPTPIFFAEDITSPFLLKEPLEPGMYYWKLETSKEMIHFGKFYVNQKDILKPEIRSPGF